MRAKSQEVFIYTAECEGGIELLDAKTFKVKAYDGEEKEVKKITLFPEKDGYGDIFYKIEGWLNTSYCMIYFSYDRTQTWEKYLELLQELVDYQVDNLTGATFEKN
jgi:hypothetical protein